MSITFNSGEYEDIESSLSSCPFCGGKASLEFGSASDVWVECECGASGPWVLLDRDDENSTRREAAQLAADSWNKQTAAPDLLAAAKEALVAINKLWCAISPTAKGDDGISRFAKQDLAYQPIEAAIAKAEEILE